MKKWNIVSGLLSVLMLVAGVCFGVLAARKIEYDIGGKIEYFVEEADVTINARVYGYTSGELLDGGQAYEMMEELKTTNLNARTLPQGLTEMSFDIPQYSSKDTSSTSYYDQLNIQYGDDENQSYAYFIVINIQNNNKVYPVYAIAGDIVNPSNSWQTNSSGYSSIYYGETKNVVFAFGLEDLNIGVENQPISYQLHIGTLSDNENLTYDEFDDQNLTCTVTGLQDYENYPSPIVVVPNTHTVGNKTYKVTAVNGPLVGYESPVTGIVFGDNIESITDAADGYENCTSECDMLTTVVFSESENLTSIDYFSFSDQKLYSINIPKYISEMFLLSNNEISVLYIPENITSGMYNEDYDYYSLSYINETTGGLDFARVNENNTAYTSMVDGEHINAVLTDDATELYNGSNFISYVPDTVNVIHDCAFHNMEKLTEINIPSSVSYIGWGVFSSNEEYNITKVYADSLESWLNIEFAGSDSNPLWSGNASLYIDNQVVTSVTIPNDRTTLNDYVFYNYKKLTTVTFEENSILETLTGFANTGITSITIPKSVSSINSNYGVRNCTNLKKLIIEKESNIQELSYGIFSGLTSLEELSIPFVGSAYGATKNTHFGYIFGASKNTNNENYVPETLTKLAITGDNPISNSAFSGCNNFKSVEISTKNLSISAGNFSDCMIEEVVCEYEKDDYTLINGKLTIKNIGTSPAWKKDNVSPLVTEAVIPEDCTELPTWTFGGCNIESITIPKNLTSIAGSAFASCRRLKYITIDSENTEYNTTVGLNAIIDIDDKILISGTPNTVIPSDGSVTEIGEYAFDGRQIESIVIPETVTTLGWSAFDGSLLTSITIPASVETIGNSVFNDCINLETVTFAENSSLKSLGNNVFGNTKISSIVLPASVNTLDVGAFGSCANLSSIVVEEGNTTFTSANGANCIIEIETKTLVRGCTNTVIPTDGSVTKLGAGAFAGTNFTNLKIPSVIEEIDCTFSNATLNSINTTNGLKIITSSDDSNVKFLIGSVDSSLPSNGAITASHLSGVKVIAMSVFDYSTKLTSIEIPATVVSIGRFAFAYCYNLSQVTFAENSQLKVINEYAFSECKLTSLTIPENVETIAGKAFYGNTNLQTITIKGSILTFDSWAISDCTAVSNVIIEDIEFLNRQTMELYYLMSMINAGETIKIKCSSVDEIEEYDNRDVQELLLNDQMFTQPSELVDGYAVFTKL